MKTKILFALITLNILFNLKIYAQAPIYSTEDQPIWQYIKVEGTGDRIGRVLTSEDGRVYGRPIYLGLDRSYINNQLWRVEKVTSNAAMIINKSTGKKMDVEYDASLKIRVVKESDVSSTNWRFQKYGNYYNMRIITEPEEGTKGTVMALMAPSTSRRNYILTFDVTSNYADANAKFEFIKFDTSLPYLSNDDREVWYLIKSAKPGMENNYVTAIANPTDLYIKFMLTSKEENNFNQYWKLVKVNDDVNNLNYYIQNKGTQEIISTKVILDRYFYVQNTNNIQEDHGWILNSIGSGQYEIQGKDGKVVRYLNAASFEEKSDTYIPEFSKDTGFAWSFERVSGEVGVKNPINSNLKTYSENGCIYVYGVDDYTVKNIYGSLVEKNATLSTGIYFVTANGETIKVLVK